MMGVLTYYSYETMGVFMTNQIKNDNNGVPDRDGRFTNVFSNATTTPRYLTNGAASTTNEFPIQHANTVSIALQHIASSAKATLLIELQYGVPSPTSTGATVINWFSNVNPIGGPQMGFQTGTSTGNSFAPNQNILGSSTQPYLIESRTSTSSIIFEVPGHAVPFMRFNATFLGSNGAVWMNAFPHLSN